MEIRFAFLISLFCVSCLFKNFRFTHILHTLRVQGVKGPRSYQPGSPVLIPTHRKEGAKTQTINLVQVFKSTKFMAREAFHDLILQDLHVQQRET